MITVLPVIDIDLRLPHTVMRPMYQVVSAMWVVGLSLLHLEHAKVRRLTY